MLHCLLTTCALWTSCPVDDAAADLKRLEGAWRLVEVITDGKIRPDKDLRTLRQVFAADGGYVLIHRGEIVGKGSLKLDPGQKPAAFEMTYAERNEFNGAFTPVVQSKGIYHLEGDTLKLCGTRQGDENKPRPTAFASPAGANLVYEALKRTADAPTLDKDFELFKTPFQCYTTRDELGRTITFYLSRPPSDDFFGSWPTVLFVQGSGSQSLWKKRDDKVAGGLQNLVLDAVKARARVLVVEKPGVRRFDNPERPGSAMGAPEEFLREHTLPRWVEANAAALRAVWTMAKVDSRYTLAVGHSEGGLVVSQLAGSQQGITHVACLAGGGPTQLFDLAELMGKPRDAIYAEWKKIQADPASTSKMWLGHPYRRWSSFLAHNSIDPLAKTAARIYLVQGSADKAVLPAAHDVLVAELLARGKDVTHERIEGGDHGFSTSAQQPGAAGGMRPVLERIAKWYLSDAERKE